MDPRQDDLLDVDLKSIARHAYDVANQTGRLVLSRMKLEKVPRSIEYLTRLVELDLSHNRLVRFPGRWLAQLFPHLGALSLACNELQCLQDILDLSKLSRLHTLNVEGNPLPLVSNRIYLLEALFRAPSSSTTRAAAVVVESNQTSMATTTAAPVPRREGFAMLQYLNGEMISLDDIQAVERELGRRLRYDTKQTSTLQRKPKAPWATRKTVQEILKKEMASATFPPVKKLPVLRYAVDGHATPEPLRDEDDAPDEESYEGLTKDEAEELRRELRLGLIVDAPASPTFVVDSAAAVENSSWNDPILSFDTLPIDQRCLVREKAKRDTSLEDNPFEANLVVENMVQAERSRRLTQRSIHILSSTLHGSASEGSLRRQCDTAEQLVERLNTQHTRAIVERNFQLTETFCKQEVRVGETRLAPEFRDVIEIDLKQIKATNSKLIGKTKLDPTTLVDSIDLGLSRVRNENAVEGVVKSLNANHEKRLIQALIDSDQQVVEEEVRRQKMQEHKDRLEKIARRGQIHVTVKSPRKVSGWQRRNALAASAQVDFSPSKVKGRAMPQRKPGRRILPYERIETVEEARLDALPSVTTKELLLRCASIRKQSRANLQALGQAKHDFVENEIHWEERRRDPIELLRRKVKASACDGNELMIGNQEFIYLHQ
ncbi:hypothetical protein Ae201684_006439 [Aphanomyces euteiches]|uniref:U2A'/phosphoprotein 32 family A C-terminal domain-containing protein n=1 Tax=Aphanomyces euteiches TaxID=100861 RepID=A0A6G0XB75_9STRA|nr:hypothetical protein Ae201684_006439 [Aphanomyces euteiches]KAH9146404.1 hypothetical protein AeRB84_009664 [Aphanomyces euteiches]